MSGEHPLLGAWRVHERRHGIFVYAWRSSTQIAVVTGILSDGSERDEAATSEASASVFAFLRRRRTVDGQL